MAKSFAARAALRSAMSESTRLASACSVGPDAAPAHCGDPECDADHGYSGTFAADDLTVRMSVAADGADNVARLVTFATALQLAGGGGR